MKPELGHCVELPDGGRAVVSEMYTPDLIGICRLEDVYGGHFFYGPGHGRPRLGAREHVSVSGGPHPAIERSRFEETPDTAEVPTWHWRDTPRAGGGEQTTRTVKLWKLREPFNADDTTQQDQ